MLFEVVRYEPKTFRQRKPDSTLEGWTWNTKGVEKVLFRLPEILRDMERGCPIFICEGEKDTLAMVQRGFSATCNVGGAGKWVDSYSETLTGADVVILPDRDAPGRAHAQDVATKLHSKAKSIRVAVESGAAVCYGCHFAKGNASAKEAIDRISGSGVFARDPDSLLIFTKHDEPDAFTVDPILRNFAPIEPFVVRWNFPLFESATELDPSKLKQVAGKKKEHDPLKLLAAIASNDELNPVSVSRWAELTEIPRTTLNDYVTEMRRKGWIKTIGEGLKAKQAITNKGKEILNANPTDGN